MSDIGDWFRSIPAITRYWFAATVAVPLVGKLGLISPAYFFLWPEAFLYRFQVLTGDWGSGDYRLQVAPQRRSVDRLVADARCLVGLVVRWLQRFRAGSCGQGLGWRPRGLSVGLGSWRRGGRQHGLARWEGIDFVLPLKLCSPPSVLREGGSGKVSLIVVNLLDASE